MQENSYTYINKQGNTTNLNNSFFTERKKELLRWDSKAADALTTKLPRQFNGWVKPKLYKGGLT